MEQKKTTDVTGSPCTLRPEKQSLTRFSKTLFMQRIIPVNVLEILIRAS